jgi:UDP-N-acetylmuramate dehydrogenase
VQATFAVTADEPAACEARVAEIVRWRREHQPGGANAGSVFRNPPGDSAGRLVDAAGLKGLRVGGAVVSEKHANFIQAEPGATAADVRALVLEVQRRVAGATGVELAPELHFVGFGDDGAEP